MDAQGQEVRVAWVAGIGGASDGALLRRLGLRQLREAGSGVTLAAVTPAVGAATLPMRPGLRSAVHRGDESESRTTTARRYRA